MEDATLKLEKTEASLKSVKVGRYMSVVDGDLPKQTDFNDSRNINDIKPTFFFRGAKLLRCCVHRKQ